MSLDSLKFDYSARAWEYFIQGFNPNSPSYRDAEIQIAKYRKMATRYQKTIGAAPQSGTSKTLNKAMGQQKHRLSQQRKIVDKCIRNVLEEWVIQTLAPPPGGAKITRKKIRGNIQVSVNGLNRQIHQGFQKLLDAAYSSARDVLSGGKV